MSADEFEESEHPEFPMKVGVTIFLTDESARAEEVAKLAELYEFESLWLPDHTHIPSLRKSQHPLFKDEIPREYLRMLDVFVALTMAAAATKRLAIGTGICVLSQRDPIVTAKAVASLDFVSNGRFLFGVGAGWNLEEVANHGIDPNDRFKVLVERIEAMQAIWTQDVASYSGHFVSFEEIWSWPKPLQSPHPPILLGANGPRAVERAVKLGAHWLPGYHKDDNYLISRILEYRKCTEDQLGVTLSMPPLDRSRLARLADAGVDRAFFLLPTAKIDEVERRIDEVRHITADL